MKSLLICLIIFATQFIYAQEIPLADPKATVLFGNARFTILTPELIRMEYSTNKRFEDHASLVFINRRLPVPRFTQQVNNNALTINTGKLTLKFMNDGKPFHSNNLDVTITSGGPSTSTWTPGLKDTLNLKGTNRTLDQINGWQGLSRLENGLVSRSGWALVDDSKTPLFDGAKDWNWVMPRTDTLQTDWYLFGYGHNYKKALLDFTRVAGKIPMPPKYAFGYWWSRYWIYNDTEFRDLVKQIRSLDIPLDVLIIDMDWHETYNFSAHNIKTDPEGQMVGWTGYTWNKNLFPEPAKFLQWTNEQKLQTALNLHPASGVPPMEEMYDAFAAAYGFDTTGRKYIPFLMSDKKWAKTYFNVLLRPMEKMGVDFWWLDWQQYLQDKKIKNLGNTWWLNYTFFTNMQQQGNKRPLLFHRWGGLGNHRYQVGFSGDAQTSWETLDYEIYFTATASNVGYGYWSHDIGGHISSGPTDGEMYLRWLQFGALSPVLRTHSSKLSETERRIWMFPGQFNDMRDALKLRYALVPYIYKYAREAYDSGISICRPMYYDYPSQENAYLHKAQYMLGDDLLAAPVSAPASPQTGLAAKTIWLPEGDWFEYGSGTMLRGNKVITRKYTQSEIPMFFKAGSIIPLYPDVKNLQEVPPKLILSFIPGGTKTTATVYEDDGTTGDYRFAKYAVRTITKEVMNDKLLKITIAPVKGSYSAMPAQKALELQLLNTTAPVRVLVNNTPYHYHSEEKQKSWTYSAKDLATSVHIPPTDNNKQAEVLLYFDTPIAGQQKVLDGNKGYLDRMAWVTEQLKYFVAEKDWGGTLPNSIYETGNVANIIRYHPQRVYTEMEKLNVLKTKLKAVLMNLPHVDQKKIIPLVGYMEVE